MIYRRYNMQATKRGHLLCLVMTRVQHRWRYSQQADTVRCTMVRNPWEKTLYRRKNSSTLR